MSSSLNTEIMFQLWSEIMLLKPVLLQWTFTVFACWCHITGLGFLIYGGYTSVWWLYILLEGESLETVIMTMSWNYHMGQYDCYSETGLKQMNKNGLKWTGSMLGINARKWVWDDVWKLHTCLEGDLSFEREKEHSDSPFSADKITTVRRGNTTNML